MRTALHGCARLTDRWTVPRAPRRSPDSCAHDRRARQDGLARVRRTSLALPVVRGHRGRERGIDIRSCAPRPGSITLDPGYGNTGACQSAITFIDGEKGILRYRGYPIEELAEKSTFLEVAWLLIHGELPTRGRARRASRLESRATRCCTRTSGASSTRCRRTRTRCRSARRRSARSRRSTRRLETDAAACTRRVDAADREDADDRGLLVQALDRPAVHLPAERARLLRRTSCT